MLEKGIPIRAVGKRNIEDFGILQSLLHAVTNRMIVVFGLDNRDGHVGLIVQDIVGFFSLSPLHRFSTHYHSSLSKKELLTNLGHEIPFFR